MYVLDIHTFSYYLRCLLAVRDRLVGDTYVSTYVQTELRMQLIF